MTVTIGVGLRQKTKICFPANVAGQVAGQVAG